MPETDLREELEAAIERDEPFGPADESTPLREVQAATLREAIIAPLNHPDGAKRLRLQRVLIVGELDLESQQISLRLQMKDCELKDAFSIRQARAIDITLFDCVIGGPLFANQLYLRWNFRLNGSSLHNGATLLGAKIGGQLSVNSTKLKALKSGDGKVAGPAFNADRVEVSGGMFCDGMESEGEVRLLGAKVGGLSMERAKLKPLKGGDGKVARPAFNADRVEVSSGIYCRGMETEGEVRLLGAKVGGQLSITGAKLKSLKGEDGKVVKAFNADGVEVSGDMVCDGMETEGEVRLLGAKVGGQLSITGAKLKSLEGEDGKVAGPAFSADGVEVSGDMFCDGMESEGEVRLLGAKVGELSVERAKLKSLKDEEGKGMRPALNADRVRVSGSMFCRGMETEGEVRLLGAKVGGQLSITGAKLKSLEGEDGKVAKAAFNADRIEVSGSMFCRGMETEGEVRLLGAKVGGQLSMREASLTATADDKCGLKLIGAEVDELILAFKEVDGVVDVTDAKVRSLWDAEYGEFSGQHPPALRLQGFRYESLREPLSAEQRLEWIDRSQQGQHQPGVYAELAEAYRRIGHRADARAIGIASERRGREDGTLVKKIWSWLLWKSVRYGYENWRAAAGLVIVITIGSILFWVAECRFVETVREPPGLSPFIYATDVAIPVLDVGQTRTWAADGWLEWVELVLAISGYAFVAAVIAGLAGIFNRDQV